MSTLPTPPHKDTYKIRNWKEYNRSLCNVFGCPVGGWVADRFNYKIIYVLSVFLNGLFSLLFVLNPSYKFVILMWIGSL